MTDCDEPQSTVPPCTGLDYGAEITLASAVMTDGKSLEQRGVDPDELLLPQPTDLEAGSDPVLGACRAEAGNDAIT